MKMKLITTALLACLSAGSAQAVTLNFDERGVMAGDIITSFNKGGISGTVEVVGGANIAMVFDTRILSGEDTDLLAPFKRADANGDPIDNGNFVRPGNILIISEDGDTTDPDDNANGGIIRFVFDQLVDFQRVRVFDDVTGFTVYSDKGDRSDPLFINFDNGTRNVVTNFTGVRTLTFDFADASGGIDDIKVTLTPVPVPASFPLLLAGFGALAFAARRKSRKA